MLDHVHFHVSSLLRIILRLFAKQSYDGYLKSHVVFLLRISVKPIAIVRFEASVTFAS